MLLPFAQWSRLKAASGHEEMGEFVMWFQQLQQCHLKFSLLAGRELILPNNSLQPNCPPP